MKLICSRRWKKSNICLVILIIILLEFNLFAYYGIARKDRYVTGYKRAGDDPNIIIPEAIKQAILLLIGHYFENREILLERGHIPKTIPFSAEALLYSYKIWSQ